MRETGSNHRPGLNGALNQRRPATTQKGDWPICALCGQPIWPSYYYQELHSFCREFLGFLPNSAKVKVTFPKEK